MDPLLYSHSILAHLHSHRNIIAASSDMHTLVGEVAKGLQ